LIAFAYSLPILAALGLWRLYGKVPHRAVAPERVAVVVARALTQPRPRSRYRVGWDARVGTLLGRLLPGGLLDALVLARLR
jgi:hypothetical protein